MPTGFTSLPLEGSVESLGTASFPLQGEITRIDIVGTPQPKNIFNPFDEAGLALGLERLPGEKNAAYRARLLDSFAHRANSTYLGLIYGITRELGLTITKPVAFHRLVSGNSLIEIEGAEVKIWGDFINDEDPELTINRWELSLEELVAEVNTSAYIRAHLEDSSAATQPARTLLHQSNLEKVDVEVVPSATHFQLAHYPLVLERLLFIASDAFLNRVASQGALSTDGDFYVEADTGKVWTVKVPIGATVHYWYFKNPLYAQASPVIVEGLQEAAFHDQILFERLTLEDGTIQRGLPTSLGADIINESLTVYPSIYGF